MYIEDVKNPMSIKSSLLYSLALLLVSATFLTASATQDQALQLVEWEYVNTDSNTDTVSQDIETLKTIETADIVAPLPRQKPINNKALAFNILIKTESNGKHFGAPGSIAGQKEPSKSKKGAIGVAQVMPRTLPRDNKFLFGNRRGWLFNNFGHVVNVVNLPQRRAANGSVVENLVLPCRLNR